MKSSYRPAKARVNLKSIQHNLSIAKARAGTASALVVIKAEAYGHNAVTVATALQNDADEFGVASLDDVIQLRDAGIKQSIVCLSGFYHRDEIELFIEHNATAVIYDQSQLEHLRAYSLSLKANDKINDKQNNRHPIDEFKIWLKIDTGMGRLGLKVKDIESLITELSQLTGVRLIGVLSHFSNSDEPLDEKNQQQQDLFSSMTANFSSNYPELKFSLSNSAAIMSRPDCMLDMIRPGIMLYGASPVNNQTAKDLDLRPAMTFESKLISIKDINKHATVGYGSTWKAPKQMQIGVVAVGYGDGYPRHAPTGTPVLVNGCRTQLLGRVSMDLISIDLDQIDAKIGDTVTLWGDGLPVEEVAASSGTISYELLCGVTQRVARVYEK